MFIGTISDAGLSYSAETVVEVSSKLNDYIEESYGSHSVYNVKTEETLSNCKQITSPGEYLITPKRDSKNQIYCKIG